MDSQFLQPRSRDARGNDDLICHGCGTLLVRAAGFDALPMARWPSVVVCSACGTRISWQAQQ
jgi:hypothetical protein